MESKLDSFKVELEGKCMKVYTDNQNAARIIEVGSMNKEFHDIALAIVKICISYRITLIVCWLPKGENILAYFFQQNVRPRRLGDRPNNVYSFQQMWGPFTCDLFANYHNNKVNNFYSKFVTSFTTSVDTFSFDWSQDNNWIVPPVWLISKTISH